MRVLATLHLADLFRDPKMSIPTKMDYRKIRRFLNGTWPVPVPKRLVYTPQWYDLLGSIFDDADHFVIDTEYTGDQLTTLGVGIRRGNTLTGFQVHPWPKMPGWFRDHVASELRFAVRRHTTIFQNSVADIPILHTALGITYDDYHAIEDTMLAHAVLWSEWPHTLEFLASLYGVHEKMKHLSGVDPLLYNWGDVCDTNSAWMGLKDELARDPDSERIYRDLSLPLVPYLLEAKRHGIRINRERVERASVELQRAIDDTRRLAQAHVGWPLNLGSVGGTGHLARYLYHTAEQPVQYKRGAQYRRAKKVTVDADAIASLRAQIDPVPDFEAEERNGVTFADAMTRIERGADPILEARVVYGVSLQSESHYIRPALEQCVDGDGRFYPEFLIHAQANARWSTNNPPLAQLPEALRDIVYPDEGTTWIGHDWDAIELRVNAFLSNDTPTLDAFDAGWDIHSLNAQAVFLEDRLAYATNVLCVRKNLYDTPESPSQVLRQLVSELEAGMDRTVQDWLNGVPEAQKEWCARVRAPRGHERWPGRGCTSREWTTRRQSTPELDRHESFRAHCAAYAAWVVAGGPPPDWQGKDDARRIFTKRFVFRLDYGGDPKNAGDIPGAQTLGFVGRAGSQRLIVASQRYLSAHPAKAEWRRETEQLALTKGEARTLYRRRRRLMGDRHKKVRDAFDFPMQGSVSDWFNETFLLIKGAPERVKTRWRPVIGDAVNGLPWLQWMYGMHDSQWWQGPNERVGETWPIYRAIVERPLTMNGRTLHLPATFKQCCPTHRDCFARERRT